MSARALLLDTCALIWFANGEPLQNGAGAAIAFAAMADGAFVSPISAWEVGLLSRQKSGRAMIFRPEPLAWFARFMAAPGVQSAPFTADIAIAASQLPEPLHSDPADRLLIATARDLAIPIVTRDAKILAYAEVGHIQTIPC